MDVHKESITAAASSRRVRTELTLANEEIMTAESVVDAKEPGWQGLEQADFPFD